MIPKGRFAARLSVLPVALLCGWGAAVADAPAAGATSPTTAPPAPPPAKAELLVDVDTGRVLASQNAHTRLPPGSLSKVLTAMIAADWLPPDAVVPVSARAAGVYPDKVGMKAGQRWRLSIALHALLISSANDAAYALAERVSGTVERFAATMQDAATQLGLTDDPVLHDPAGLDGSEGAGGGNLMSAWDLATAARDMMADPRLAAIAGQTSYRFTGPDGIVYELASHNRAFLNSYPGAIGVKTGFTDRAGVCVIEEAQRGGRHMMAVVMNGYSPDQTAALLLDKGFATPVRAEPAAAAMLPPARRPEPPGPGPSRKVIGLDPTPVVPSTGPEPVPARSAAAAVPHPAGGLLEPGQWGLVAVAVATAGGVIVITRARRRRRLPARHRRRG